METVKSKVVAGVDVDSRYLVTYVSSKRKEKRFENTPKGTKRALAYFEHLGVTLVVCESTGGYETLLCEALWAKGTELHVAHPKAVRAFAKALGKTAKTDPIDGYVLSEYGLRMELKPTARPSKEFLELRRIVGRYHDLRAMLIQEKNRLTAPALPRWMKSELRASVRHLVRKMKLLITRMREHLAKAPTLSALVEELDREKGIGFLSAAVLVAEMPELGTLNRRSAPALAGLAPFNRDSGKSKGSRTIYGGRTRVRTAIYMAALSVIRERGTLRSVYLRLIANGKKKMVALVAVMRKLIIRLNSRMKALLQSHLQVTLEA